MISTKNIFSFLFIALVLLMPLHFIHADAPPETQTTGAAPGTQTTGAAPGTQTTGAAPGTQTTGAAPGTQTTGAAPGTPSGTLQNPLNAQSLQQLLQEVLAYVQIIGGIFLTLMLVVVGFLFVVAQGNPEKVSQARSALLWTAIGGLLLLGAEGLSIVISSTVQAL